MKEYTVEIHVSAQELERYYRGQAQNLVARDAQGRILRLPLGNLRAHVRHDGLQGRFAITTDDNNRLLSIQRL